MVATSLVLALGSGLAALALPTQQPLIGINFADEFKTSCNVNNPAAEKTYYGVGNNKDTNAGQVKLRISNGGAGLSGLVGALADEFITYMVNKTDIDKRVDPFRVEWVKGDTTETLNYLATGQADIGITYNKAAECQAMSDKVAARRVYGFRDHFYLVGPHNNPAGLNVYQNGTANQTVFTQFQKIVSTGNNATHKAAALLEEYTITDRGTWLSTPKNITEMLVLYNEGKDDETQDNPDVVEGPADPLLNPAFFLTSTKICEENKDLADAFLDWVVDRALGQEVIKGYRRNDSDEWLYTGAPNRTDLRIQNCTIQGS
ncbi:hypothetical protein RhiTH_006374 [Rhizoctonia solani]